MTWPPLLASSGCTDATDPMMKRTLEGPTSSVNVGATCV